MLPDKIRKDADVIKKMTISQIKALPGILGIVASAKSVADGYYAYTNTTTSEKTLIILQK